MKNTSALPIARVSLRILIVLNWVYGAVVFAILVGSFAAEQWTAAALGFAPSASVIQGMRMIAALGLVGVPLNFIVLSRLLAMVNTVSEGNAFIAQNAARLQTIAWAVFGQQLLQLAVSIVARGVSTPAHPLHVNSVSTAGWLAVILLFVLARVFLEGARMRDDLEGTV